MRRVGPPAAPGGLGISEHSDRRSPLGACPPSSRVFWSPGPRELVAPEHACYATLSRPRPWCAALVRLSPRVVLEGPLPSSPLVHPRWLPESARELLKRVSAVSSSRCAPFLLGDPPSAMNDGGPHNPRAPPRVAALRRAVGQLLDMLRFFGLANGPPPRAAITVDMPTPPMVALFYVAAQLTVDWANVAARTGSGGAGGLFPARPAPVPRGCVNAALLVSCRACALSLVKDGLMAEEDDEGTPFGISMEGLDPVCKADAYAVSAAAMASRAVWTQVPYWEGSVRQADEDLMRRAIEAARAPLPGESLTPASADYFPRLVSQAALACAPVPLEPQGREAVAGPSTAPGVSVAGQAHSSSSESDVASSRGSSRRLQERLPINQEANSAALEAAPGPALASASSSGSSSGSMDGTPESTPERRRRGRARQARATDDSAAASTATTSTTPPPASRAG